MQSTVLALMAHDGAFANGRIPDVAIYADTGWDPPSTRATVDWVRSVVQFPVEVVQAGNLADDTANRRSADGAEGFYAIPAYLDDGRMTNRQCTTQYKIRPILASLRKRLGYGPGERIPPHSVEQWLGISWDEMHRMKPARDVWITNRWPLVEHRISRHQCLRWWGERAPSDAPQIGRSACVGCPFHSRAEWLDLADNHPDLIEHAAAIEQAMSDGEVQAGGPPAFLHRRRIPLLQAIEADREIRDSQPELDLWGSECEGMCGV